MPGAGSSTASFRVSAEAIFGVPIFDRGGTRVTDFRYYDTPLHLTLSQNGDRVMNRSRSNHSESRTPEVDAKKDNSVVFMYGKTQQNEPTNQTDVWTRW